MWQLHSVLGVKGSMCNGVSERELEEVVVVESGTHC